jgi:hypothetical protein
MQRCVVLCHGDATCPHSPAHTCSARHAQPDKHSANQLAGSITQSALHCCASRLQSWARHYTRHLGRACLPYSAHSARRGFYICLLKHTRSPLQSV